jgi:four helix bundle protein
MEAYRLALFAADVGWHDVTKLTSDRRTRDLSSQLYRAIGSIGANISEGYSRGTGRDRARFYEYALGSARESRTWYYDGRHILPEKVVHHRINLVTEIIRLLLKTVPDQRGSALKEESPVCYCELAKEDSNEFLSSTEQPNLLESVPLP